MSDIGSATNKKLLEMFNMMKSGDLILRPSFQRKLVWNDGHKENFIDTILAGLPFPEIYLADGDIDLETQKLKTLVVDGQQRLSTIYQFVNGSSDFVVKKIPTFKSLSPKEQTRFFDYKIVVRDLGRIEDDQLIDIFKRINSIQYALNAVEINNALYDGEFISTAKEVINSPFLRNLEVFTENEYLRMKDLDFILLLQTTIEAEGYFSQSKEVENYIKKYDDKYPNKEQTRDDLVNSLGAISQTGLPADSLWFKKSSFFTLVIELVRFKRQQGFLPDSKSLKLKLSQLENEIIRQKNDADESNRFSRYYRYVYQNTQGRVARVARGELLQEHLLQLK